MWNFNMLHMTNDVKIHPTIQGSTALILPSVFSPNLDIYLLLFDGYFCVYSYMVNEDVFC